MMNALQRQKIQAGHLKRRAYLYVRQSTMQQVIENTESAQRQYAMRQRAVELGWPAEQVVVIDSDQGQSGASTGRRGFQRLVAEVGMGQAGLVMGLEVSRLARNSADWHRLLQICALTETLILDEDGLYDPNCFNDRLLLGLKGTMSEAEWHMIRSRLRGGLLSKARRGELRTALPVGFAYDGQGQVELDPDRQVQQAVRLFFSTFRRTGSAYATAKAFRGQGLLFPRRPGRGPRQGRLRWDELGPGRALRMLHNPRYAGAYSFGRTRSRRRGDGTLSTRRLPQDEWHALIPEAHEGYISWQEFQDNQKRLKRQAPSSSRTLPREGAALLQGLLVCGRCGRRMSVHYYRRGRQGTVGQYACQEKLRPVCQQFKGTDLDAAVGRLVIESVTPLALEVALQVQEELQSRLEEADRLRRQQVQRAHYEADLARRRLFQVDPENRLVADELEAAWNAKLQALAQAEKECERGRSADRLMPDGRRRQEILALATDFPRLWDDPKTSHADRKRMIRLLIEDITVIRGERITAQIRFKGGAAETLSVAPALHIWKLWKTPSEVIREVDRLLEDHTYSQAAALLAERGMKSGKGMPIDGRMVCGIKRRYGLKSRYERLRARGLLTRREVSERLGVSCEKVSQLRQAGLIKGQLCSDKNEYLYEPPTQNLPESVDSDQEVQYET